MKMTNGMEYFGYQIGKVMHGAGKLTYPNGESIEGDFIEGKTSGLCAVKYPDGSSYQG